MITKITSRRFLSWSLALLASAALITSGSPAQASKGKKNAAETRVEGVLSSVDLTLATASIVTKGGQTVIVGVTAATKIERNDRRASLAQLQIGDRAQARIVTATGVTTKLETVGR